MAVTAFVVEMDKFSWPQSIEVDKFRKVLFMVEMNDILQSFEDFTGNKTHTWLANSSQFS